MVGLLSADTVCDYLRRRGVLADGAPAAVEELGGGVSNVVLAVRAPRERLLVKQSLPRLRVADEWLAKRERAVTEAAALAALAELDPRALPRLLDVDAEACALTIELAPEGWRPWKELLLAGEADAAVASRLGSLLARWQRETAGEETARRFADVDAFVQLRVDPYHRTTMARRPELAAAIEPYVESLLHDRACLVHGDFSPKNVLVGDGGALWVIDWEVAHFGNGVFDVAFMLNHLLLKSVHLPPRAGAFRACARAFLEPLAGWDGSALAGHVGCLLLARVHGKSPAEYLDARGQAAASALGESLLLAPPARVDEAWARL